jgi:hypothetical protein
VASFDVFATGTCFTYKKDQQYGPVINVRPMQILTWVSKDNRPGNPTRGPVAHPRAGEKYLDSAQAAYDYVAKIYESLWPDVLSTFGIGRAEPVTFLPVPSTDYVVGRQATRFPAHALASALVSRGLGTGVNPGFAWRAAHAPRTAGTPSRPPEAIVADLVACGPAPSGRIVLVDDMMTHGNHLAAVHSLVPSTVGAVCLAFAQMNDQLTDDCYRPEVRRVTYAPGPPNIFAPAVTTSLRRRMSAV